MQRVQKAQAVIANHRQITAAVKGKLERLRATANIGIFRRHGAHGGFVVGRERRLAESWNVLAEDYWDLYNLLLR